MRLRLFLFFLRVFPLHLRLFLVLLVRLVLLVLLGFLDSLFFQSFLSSSDSFSSLKQLNPLKSLILFKSPQFIPPSNLLKIPFIVSFCQPCSAKSA